MPVVLATGLGHVHGHVGAAQKQRRIIAIGLQQGHTNAQPYMAGDRLSRKCFVECSIIDRATVAALSELPMPNKRATNSSPPGEPPHPTSALPT